MTVPITDIGIYAPADTWARLRVDPAFCELLRLARVVNSLTLAYGPLLAPIEDQSPAARRERFAAFFYAAALLHEGLHTAQSLGKHFKDLPAYKNGIAALLGDEEVTRLRSDLLNRIRDKLVFHFDRDAIGEGLSQFPEGEALIATSTDLTHGGTYFDAADDALAGYLFGDASTEEAFHATLGQFMARVTALFNRFNSAAHSLIAAALTQMGCVSKSFPRPIAPEDNAG